MDDRLWKLKKQIEAALKCKFNAVLVNYYRDGSDYVGWHSDDEVELGDKPLIASLSPWRRKGFCLSAKGGSPPGNYDKAQHRELVSDET